jgi:hypothetical protein
MTKPQKVSLSLLRKKRSKNYRLDETTYQIADRFGELFATAHPGISISTTQAITAIVRKAAETGMIEEWAGARKSLPKSKKQRAAMDPAPTWAAMTPAALNSPNPNGSLHSELPPA